MAFTATGILIVRPSGSDSNGGGFNPGSSGFATDLATDTNTANTGSPVVSSASYNFVAGDVGARVFVKSGTNWLSGWYTIASVASNKATLTASIGNATLFNGTFASGLNSAFNVNNTVSGGSSYAGGCSKNNTATLTAGTWGVDYSNQDASQFTFTDITTAGSGSTFTSAAHPVGKNFVGNYLNITSGTNLTAQRYEVISTSTITATVDKAISTGVSTNGAGGLGGALASPGMAGRLESSAPGARVSGTDIFIKSGTYVVTSSTANVSGGVFSDATGGAGSNAMVVEGFGTIPRDVGTAPTIQLQASLGSGIAVVTVAAVWPSITNITVDCNSNTTSTAFSLNGFATGLFSQLTALNFKTAGISATGGDPITLCIATGGAGTAGFSTGTSPLSYCESYGNTCPGFSTSSGCVTKCIASGNSGATSDGFVATAGMLQHSGCVSYGNGRHGFFLQGGSPDAQVLTNCIAEANGGYGFAANTTAQLARLGYCGAYNNTSGAFDSSTIPTPPTNFVLNTTGTFFTNAASGDFSLNNTANQGALARAAGFPGVMPRGTSTGHVDIGAIQHADAGGGGSTGGSYAYCS